jgi:hypothetical protein
LQGKRNKAICRDLNLAQPTVKNHVTAILRQLGVSNRVEAVLAVGALEMTKRPKNILPLSLRDLDADVVDVRSLEVDFVLWLFSAVRHWRARKTHQRVSQGECGLDHPQPSR